MYYRKAVSDLPNGKAAGINGIPHELWKLLSNKFENDRRNNNRLFDIIKSMTLVYNNIEKHSVCSETDFPKGWLCPIHKKGDRTEVSNYRPITVLNRDYKTMTRALTTRLVRVISPLIHLDQAGFMKGRRIEHQTDLIMLMINKSEVDEENGVIVCLDQEKAYDKIHHDFIWKTLDKFNFPNHFKNTLKTLYQNGEIIVILNGEKSISYKVTRGV